MGRTGDDPVAWRDLGFALTEEGDAAGAAQALRRAIALDPADRPATVALAHLAYVLGDAAEATALLARAADQDPVDAGLLHNLLDMHRAAGSTTEALEVARRLVALGPEDVIAAINLADLLLETDALDEAFTAFGRLRTVDPAEGHAVVSYHGMIEVDIRRGRYRQALDTAIAATAVDRHSLTTDVLAHVTAQLFGAADRPAPDWTELAKALEAERREHGRLHAEAVVTGEA